MKKVKLFSFMLLSIMISAISCKSEAESEKSSQEKPEIIEEKLQTFRGEFIHVDTAAVLKGRDFIYGVKMDETTKSLIKEVKLMMKDEYDVVNVIVKGELYPNDQEGWEEILTLKSVEKVYKSQPKEETKVIKYSSKQKE